jgi:hypothetical protein
MAERQTSHEGLLLLAAREDRIVHRCHRRLSICVRIKETRQGQTQTHTSALSAGSDQFVPAAA